MRYHKLYKERTWNTQSIYNTTYKKQINLKNTAYHSIMKQTSRKNVLYFPYSTESRTIKQSKRNVKYIKILYLMRIHPMNYYNIFINIYTWIYKFEQCIIESENDTTQDGYWHNIKKNTLYTMRYRKHATVTIDNRLDSHALQGSTAKVDTLQIHAKSNYCIWYRAIQFHK